MQYLYATVAGAVLMLVSFIGGCHYNAEKYEAQAASVRAQDVQIAKAMEPQLQHTLTTSHTVTVTLIKKVPPYVDRYIPAPGAASQTRPAYYLTWGSVELWNDALGAGTASGAASTTAGADPLDLSAIRFDGAETNAIQNFGQYRDCRTIVKGWQDWYATVKKVKP